MAKPDVAQPEERERQAKALEMRLAGMPYAAIADHLGYADHSGARRAVEAVLKRQESEAAEQYRQLEDMRLDIALRKVWPGVMAGDLKAIEAWLRVHDRRVKLHGLAMPEKVVLQGMVTQEVFTTTVTEDLRALGVDPSMDTPLEEHESERWANT